MEGAWSGDCLLAASEELPETLVETNLNLAEGEAISGSGSVAFSYEAEIWNVAASVTDSARVGGAVTLEIAVVDVATPLILDGKFSGDVYEGDCAFLGLEGAFELSR